VRLTYFNKAKSPLFCTRWADFGRFLGALPEWVRIKTSASLYIAGEGSIPELQTVICLRRGIGGPDDRLHPFSDARRPQHRQAMPGGGGERGRRVVGAGGPDLAERRRRHHPRAGLAGKLQDIAAAGVDTRGAARH
jgi:hypothetical protein